MAVERETWLTTLAGLSKRSTEVGSDMQIRNTPSVPNYKMF
jgi:hypothetical protein